MEFDDFKMYYLLRAGEQDHTGPFSRRMLREMSKAGTLGEGTLTTVKGMDSWIPVATVLDPGIIKSEPAKETPASPKPKDDATLEYYGWIILLAGGFGALFFMFVFGVSIQTPGGPVANLDRMNLRLIGVIASMGCAIIGAIFIGFGSLRNTLSR